LANGNVQILIYDPNGNTAALQNYASQNFATDQSQAYSFSFTPALAGNYTVEVGVFSSTWQLWDWNASAATITVKSTTTFRATATAMPASVAVGATSAIEARVTATGTEGLTNGIVELQVFSQSGDAMATTYWTGQNFTSGEKLKYSYSWTPDSSVPAGTYNVDIGVFNSNWTTNYSWTSGAATITVTN